MKFHQLPIGSRFRYKGLTLRKVSPLKAATENAADVQKLIPRSALVDVVDEQGERLSALPEQIDGERLETLLLQFLSRCDTALRRVEPSLSEDQLRQASQMMQSASETLRQELIEAATRPS